MSLGTLKLGNHSTHLPIQILESIGENIIVADLDYNIVWINPQAVDLLTKVFPLFDIEVLEDLIGMNMGKFHQKPEYQEKIMKNFSGYHRARINIKDQYVADIVITSILDSNKTIGYVVMLMDVTTKANEERKNQKIIEELSAPILHIWDNTLALPLKGIVDENRYQIIFEKLLQACVTHEAYYVIIDFSGLTEWSEETPNQIRNMINSLELMGIQAMMVGFTPKLAKLFASYSPYNVPILPTSKAAIKRIIALTHP